MTKSTALKYLVGRSSISYCNLFSSISFTDLLFILGLNFKSSSSSSRLDGGGRLGFKYDIFVLGDFSLALFNLSS